MIRRIIASTFFVTAASALVLSLCTYSVDPWLETPILGLLASAMNKVFVGAALIGVIVSGNVHQPNALVTALSMFIIYWAIAYLVARLIRLAWRRSGTRPGSPDL